MDLVLDFWLFLYIIYTSKHIQLFYFSPQVMEVACRNFKWIWVLVPKLSCILLIHHLFYWLLWLFALCFMQVQRWPEPVEKVGAAVASGYWDLEEARTVRAHTVLKKKDMISRAIKITGVGVYHGRAGAFHDYSANDTEILLLLRRMLHGAHFAQLHRSVLQHVAK